MSFWKRTEQYLDKELLGKETKTPEKPLEIHTRGRNQTSTQNQNHKYDRKHWLLWTLTF